MKRFAGLLVVLAVMLSSSAFGATQDFGKFTAYVPAGWTAHEQKAGVFIVRDDRAAQFGIMFGKLDKGQPLEEFARAVCASVKGTNFKKDEAEDELNVIRGSIHVKDA